MHARAYVTRRVPFIIAAEVSRVRVSAEESLIMQETQEVLIRAVKYVVCGR